MTKTETTASELAAAKEYFGTAIRYPINAGEKNGLILFAELRRLEEVELNSDAICDVNDELRKRITELEDTNAAEKKQ